MTTTDTKPTAIEAAEFDASGYCPACKFYRGHAASCPTMLRTPEQRIARAAHLCGCFYIWQAIEISVAEGISQEEFHEGMRLRDLVREEYLSNRAYYGDPAYGSWPSGVKQPVRDKLTATSNSGPEVVA